MLGLGWLAIVNRGSTLPHSFIIICEVDLCVSEYTMLCIGDLLLQLLEVFEAVESGIKHVLLEAVCAQFLPLIQFVYLLCRDIVFSFQCVPGRRWLGQFDALSR